MESFWADEVSAELSQGDLLTGVWVGGSVSPRKALHRGQTGAKGVQNWQESEWKADANGIGHYLARGRDVPVLVISQDCEMDKRGGAVPVLVAPIFPMSVIQTEAIRDKVRSGDRFAFLYLPNVSGAEDEGYVDLRMTHYVVRPLIDAGSQIKSASEYGRRELVSKIIAFYTRKDVNGLNLV